MKLKPHPAAEIFPPMSEEEFRAFKEDIRQRQQIDPIVLLDGKILDGRHRYRACRELGLEPLTREWDGQGSPVEFVVSRNLHRRHLSGSQKATVAVDLLPWLEKEAKERQRAAGKAHGRGRPRGKVPEKVPEAN